MLTADAIALRVLDDVVQDLGLLRTFQLLNEIEMNNYKLAAKYPPLSAYRVASFRSVCFENRLSLKIDLHNYLLSQITIRKVA